MAIKIDDKCLTLEIGTRVVVVARRRCDGWWEPASAFG